MDQLIICSYKSQGIFISKWERTNQTHSSKSLLDIYYMVLLVFVTNVKLSYVHGYENTINVILINGWHTIKFN